MHLKFRVFIIHTEIDKALSKNFMWIDKNETENILYYKMDTGYGFINYISQNLGIKKEILKLGIGYRYNVLKSFPAYDLDDFIYKDLANIKELDIGIYKIKLNFETKHILKNKTCSKCGLRANYFNIETKLNSKKIELNFYGLKGVDIIMLNSKHKISIKKGGLLDLSNYITVCDDCLLNSKKKN